MIIIGDLHNCNRVLTQINYNRKPVNVNDSDCFKWRVLIGTKCGVKPCIFYTLLFLSSLMLLQTAVLNSHHIFVTLKIDSLFVARIMMERFKDHFSISNANLSNGLSPTELEMNEKLQVIRSLIHLSLFINLVSHTGTQAGMDNECMSRAKGQADWHFSAWTGLLLSG